MVGTKLASVETLENTVVRTNELYDMHLAAIACLVWSIYCQIISAYINYIAVIIWLIVSVAKAFGSKHIRRAFLFPEKNRKNNKHFAVNNYIVEMHLILGSNSMK